MNFLRLGHDQQPTPEKILFQSLQIAFAAPRRIFAVNEALLLLIEYLKLV
jgi:hypothetical protein